jgi:hypothetical protein
MLFDVCAELLVRNHDTNIGTNEQKGDAMAQQTIELPPQNLTI